MYLLTDLHKGCKNRVGEYIDPLFIHVQYVYGYFANVYVRSVNLCALSCQLGQLGFYLRFSLQDLRIEDNDTIAIFNYMKN